MRQIKFRAWDKEKNTMLCIFDSDSQTEWFLPKVKERYAVMQFTGLLDKNGTEIFEGDILEYTGFDKKPHRGYIEFYNGAFILRLEGRVGYSPFLQGAGKNDEVIGNIYENPELLK